MKPKIEFYRNKIVMPIKNGEVARYYSDLMYIKYKDSYCWLFFSSDKKYPLDISLAELLKNLPQKPFFRCNRIEVVNLCYYSEFRENPSVVILEDGSEFSLSVRANKGFKKKKDNLRNYSPPCRNCSDCKKGSCRDYWLFSNEHDSVNNSE